MIIQKTKNAEPVGPAQHFSFCIFGIFYSKNAVSIGCAQNIKREIKIFLIIILFIIVIPVVIKPHFFEFIIYFKIILFLFSFFCSASSTAAFLILRCRYIKFIEVRIPFLFFFRFFPFIRFIFTGIIIVIISRFFCGWLATFFCSFHIHLLIFYQFVFIILFFLFLWF